MVQLPPCGRRSHLADREKELDGPVFSDSTSRLLPVPHVLLFSDGTLCEMLNSANLSDSALGKFPRGRLKSPQTEYLVPTAMVRKGASKRTSEMSDTLQCINLKGLTTGCHFFLLLFSLSCKKIRQRNVAPLTFSFIGTQGEGVQSFFLAEKKKKK